MNDPKKFMTAAPAVMSMLVVQVVALVVSFDRYYEISIFCTGPASSWLSWVFGLLHLSFLGLLMLGIASLAWPAARPAYLILIFVGLGGLAVQATLVHSHILKCDFP